MEERAELDLARAYDTSRRQSNSTAKISGARAADDVERFICHFLCVSFHRFLAAVVYHSFFECVKSFNTILRIHAGRDLAAQEIVQHLLRQALFAGREQV